MIWLVFTPLALLDSRRNRSKLLLSRFIVTLARDLTQHDNESIPMRHAQYTKQFTAPSFDTLLPE